MRPSFSEITIIDIDQAHLLGRVHSTVTGSAVDGPGLRYVIFLQGCQFQCMYCHNRDTWDMDAGRLYTVAEIMDDVLSYEKFLDKAHGGVTVSGGEALLQPDFVSLLFAKLKHMNFHTCLDTNGYVSRHLYGERLTTLLRNTDLVMLDIKQMDDKKHQHLTGISNALPLAFARYLADTQQATRIRYVVIPGYTDDEADIRALAEFVRPMTNVQLVELLPYHRMGKDKWTRLGFDYPMEGVPTPTEASMQAIQSLLERDYGLRVLR